MSVVVAVPVYSVTLIADLKKRKLCFDRFGNTVDDFIFFYTLQGHVADYASAKRVLAGL